MAYVRDQKISTGEILQLLKDSSDHTKFFYLYVSTSGRENKRQRSRQLLPGQQTLDKYVQEEDHDSTDSSGDESDEAMDSAPQPPLQLPVQENPTAQNSQQLSTSTKETRKQAMNDVHQKILPELLCNHGWQKVYDKDMKITYRALYFNTIEKQLGENDISHIRRVGKCREMIREEVEKLKKERDVNFKINSLLSRPLLYDEAVLEKQSMREGLTQRKQQMHIDTYFNKTT